MIVSRKMVSNYPDCVDIEKQKFTIELSCKKITTETKDFYCSSNCEFCSSCEINIYPQLKFPAFYSDSLNETINKTIDGLYKELKYTREFRNETEDLREKINEIRDIVDEIRVHNKDENEYSEKIVKINKEYGKLYRTYILLNTVDQFTRALLPKQCDGSDYEEKKKELENEVNELHYSLLSVFRNEAMGKDESKENDK